VLGLYSGIVGKKRSDYDDLGYPRSRRTSPGWFNSSTGLRLLGMAGGLAKKCIGRYVITNAIQIEQLQNK
jgi:hypothetical protein